MGHRREEGLQGTPGQVHRSVQESFGEGGSGKAEPARFHSSTYSFSHPRFLNVLCVQSSRGEAAIRPGCSSEFLEGEGMQIFPGPKARDSAPDRKHPNLSAVTQILAGFGIGSLAQLI